MIDRLKRIALVLAAATGFFAGVAVPAGRLLAQVVAGPAPAAVPATNAAAVQAPSPALKGADLFSRNCAHCHGDDARGDEGPDLHGLTKNDARVTSIIQNGIKGEMPRFGSKFSDADIQALIAFLRTLKD